MTEITEDYTKEEIFSLKKFFTWKTALLFILAFFIIAIFATLSDISLSEFMDDISSVNILFLIIGFILCFVAIFVDGFSWWLLLFARKINVSLSRGIGIFFSSFKVGYLVSSMGLFETAVRTVMTQKAIAQDQKEISNSEEVNSGDILSTIVLHRLLGSFAGVIIIFVVAWVMLNFDYYDSLYDISSETAFFLILFIILFALLFSVLSIAAAKNPSFLITLFNWFLRQLGKLFKGRKDGFDNFSISLEKNVYSFSEQMAVLGQTKLISLIAFICTIIPQLIRTLGLCFYFWALGIDAPFLFVLSMNFLIGNIDLIPLGIPGMEGIKEVGMSALLNLVTAPGEDSLAFSASILTRFLNFYLVTTIAVIYFYYFGKSLQKKQKHTNHDKNIEK